MNTQPWHFTAVTDPETNQKLASAMGTMGGMTPPTAGADGQFQLPEGMEMEDMPEGFSGFNGEMPGNMPEGMEMPPEGGAGFSKSASKAGIGDAPLTIVISCEEDSELSAGLAVQNMAAEAQLLGYGTKIMTAPTMSLNTDEYKAMLNVPEGQKVAAVLLVGKADSSADATASATTRNPYNDAVTVIGN